MLGWACFLLSFFYIPKPSIFISELLPDGAARIFSKLLCRGVIQTHISRAAPDWDLSDALPTELQRRGSVYSYLNLYLPLNSLRVPFCKSLEEVKYLWIYVFLIFPECADTEQF